MEVSAHRETLRLFATLRNSRLAFDSIETCIAEITHDGLVAHGEGTPASTSGETLDDVVKAIAADGATILGHDLSDPERILDRIERWDAPPGARMALDGAVHDWVGKSAGQPSWQLLGLPRTLAKPTGYTIGIASLADTLAAVANAPAVGAFKVKVSHAEDLDRLAAIRETTTLPIRIDANEAWDFETARDLTPRLRELDIQLIEQPFPAVAIDVYRRYRDLSGRLPVFVDEGCTDVASVAAARGYADGVVVKLSKSGGVRSTRRVMDAARELGLDVMLSCMCESELAISQAALLAPLADRIDLDSQFLLRDPPFRGLGLDGGRIVLGDAPGLGVVCRG